jgi:hypothetical protein
MLHSWFSAGRVHRMVRLLLILQVCGFAFSIAGTHGAFTPPSDPPTTTDFASFYSAGLLADRGTPEAAYDPAVLHATGEQAVAPRIHFNPFLNPPVFLLICAPLARLPYLAAFVLFELVTSVLWLIVTTRIAGGGRLTAMALAAVPSVWWALGWGQNSFLSASLMGLGTLLLRRRPWAAGAAFGALVFKPHFGLLIPAALVAGRQWRAAAAAALSVIALAGLTAICFGAATWEAFFHMALHARSTIESGKILFEGHVDPAGAVRLLGAGAGAGWAVQGVASLLAATCVAWAWWPAPARAHAPAQDRNEWRYAALIAGTLIAMPFLLFYDLVMASVAAAWLVRAARRHGWLAGEAFLLAALVMIDLIAFPAAAILRLAVGAAVAPILLWMAFRRARADRGVRVVAK